MGAPGPPIAGSATEISSDFFAPAGTLFGEGEEEDG